MGTFEQARPLSFDRFAVNGAVKARLGPLEGDFIDLWIHVPTYLEGYQPRPPSCQNVVTHTGNTRLVYAWGTDEVPIVFPDWKTNYFFRVNRFWDNKLLLVHSSSLSTAVGVSRRYPFVRCRFHAEEAARDRALKTVMVTAIPPNAQETSTCYVLGGNARARSTRYEGGIAAGFTSLLDSRDLERRARLAPNGVTYHQIPAAHEMGHYIGLQHRCHPTREQQGRTPGDSLNAPQGSGMGGRFGNRSTGSGEDDDYCGGAQDRRLTSDVMAFGDEINLWHAYVWEQVWHAVRQTPDGVPIPNTGWTPQLNS